MTEKSHWLQKKVCSYYVFGFPNSLMTNTLTVDGKQSKYGVKNVCLRISKARKVVYMIFNTQFIIKTNVLYISCVNKIVWSLFEKILNIIRLILGSTYNLTMTALTWHTKTNLKMQNSFLYIWREMVFSS